MQNMKLHEMNEFLIASDATEPEHVETDEVHLMMRQKNESEGVFFRFHRPRVAAILIEELLAHYRHVWPDMPDPALSRKDSEAILEKRRPTGRSKS